LLSVGGAVILLVAMAAGYDTYASRRAPEWYPASGGFVLVGGRQMHYLCQGSGEPTLVLEAGFGGGALDWSPVIPLLSATNRVCAFDRFGQDYGAPAPHPRRFSTAADELHTALETLGIQKPVVVGHSLGGALVQIYAARYDVSGVILVEGLTTADVDSVVKRLGSYQSLNFLARLGLLRPLGSLFTNHSYAASVRDQMVALRSGARALLALSDEGAIAEATAGADLRAAEPQVTAPMLLIGAEKSDVPGLPSGEFAASLEALAGRKPGSTFVRIAGAGHYVQADHPAEVAAAIESWLKR
jgi:pimeloyl-ACP methyl ester carboxylesterase